MDQGKMLPSPPGKLVRLEGNLSHFHAFGESGNPTILLETGLGMMSAIWGWLAPALAKNFRVIAYDRAGLGWSDPREGLRDSAQIASELRRALAAFEINPPFIGLGHSMGAMHLLAFHKLHPAELAGLVFLDAAHPGQMRRVRRIRSRLRNYFFYLEASNLMRRKGINVDWFEFPLARQITGLPDSDFAAAQHFFRNPIQLRTTTQEARAWEQSAVFVNDVSLGNLPLLVFTGEKHSFPRWQELQTELCQLSTRSKHFSYADASHVSFLTIKAQAERVAKEILSYFEHERLAG